MRWRGFSYFCLGLERQYKVCNFEQGRYPLVAQVKGEIRWSLKQRQRPTGQSSRPVSSTCVFSGHCTISQKGSLPQKKDMCELSLTVFLLHTNVAVEEQKYKLYFYISTSFSWFFQRFNIRQLAPNITFAKKHMSISTGSKAVNRDLGMTSYVWRCRHLLTAKAKIIRVERCPKLQSFIKLHEKILCLWVRKNFTVDAEVNHRNTHVIAYNPSDVPSVF